MKEFDPSKKRQIGFRKRWLLPLLFSLLILMVIGGIVIAILYQHFTPIYSSTSVFYVSDVPNTTPLYSASQPAGAEDMAAVICKFTTADGVVDYISQDLKKDGYYISGREIKGMISTKSDSAFFSVTISSTDPKLAYLICQSMENVLPAYSDWCNNQYEDSHYKEDADGNLVYERIPNSNEYYQIVLRKDLIPFSEVMNEIMAEGAKENTSSNIEIVSAATIDKIPNNSFSPLRYPFLIAMIVAIIQVFFSFLVVLIYFISVGIKTKKKV